MVTAKNGPYGSDRSAAARIRAAAEALVLGTDEKKRQELEAEIRKAQEDDAKK